MIDTYYSMLNEAEKYRSKETAAAIVIQKFWRMFKVKWKYQDKIRASLTIQRILRGYNGRQQFMNKKMKEDEYK